ncbi:type II toxin-antitoxin system RelE/ParE family toxin [Planktothrix sp. FACHB-1365]|uniref:type II toxin-antitoxin system RelE/ParE family toxin n=1 Tax=Planktothrix sp. FACHB-1365 TaxID=2692855 RepID=UPI0018EF87A3|nr:type II toxin-antitoxin system RelE/ParE family toxin [Planktothrix sp. FACHB-1365]
MPQKYKDKRTAKFAAGDRVKEFQAFERQAYKRLEILEAAPNKESLKALPSNRFEALGGDRKGQYSTASMTNGVFVLSGQKQKIAHLISKLSIITKGEKNYGKTCNSPWRNLI